MSSCVVSLLLALFIVFDPNTALQGRDNEYFILEIQRLKPGEVKVTWPQVITQCVSGRGKPALSLDLKTLYHDPYL